MSTKYGSSQPPETFVAEYWFVTASRRDSLQALCEVMRTLPDTYEGGIACEYASKFAAARRVRGATGDLLEDLQ